MATARFGHNTADDYNTTEDNALEAGANVLLNNGIRTSLAAGETTFLRRSLIRFGDLSGIGVGATISAATLYLYCNSEASATDYSVSVYRCLLNWLEGTQDRGDRQNDTPDSSCWNEYGSGSAWNTAGAGATSDVTGEDSTADRRATAEDTTSITGTGSYFSWDVTTAAQAWYAGTWSDYGVVIVNDSGATVNSRKSFVSSEGTDGQRPYLSVVYTTGNAPTSAIYGPLVGPMGGAV